MNPTPQIPVEHLRQLGNALFRITNGFGQVMRGVADVAGPVFADAVDPRQDPRPEADGIFNPAFVDVPESLKQSAPD